MKTKKDGTPYKRPCRMTRDKIIQFLDLVKKCGFISRAAEAAGLTYRAVRLKAQKDESFDRRIKEALQYYTESLEIEADRRGKDGIDKPIFYQGEKVAEVKEFSDQLLMFRLKALRPDIYRERVDQNVTGDLKIEVVQFGDGLSNED